MALRTISTGNICVLLTESGSAITASCVGLGNSTAPPPGQAGKPVPGYNGKTVLNMLLEKDIAYIPEEKLFNFCASWEKQITVLLTLSFFL